MTTKRSGPVSELFPMVYGELRRVAGRYLRRERRNHRGAQPVSLDDLLVAGGTNQVPVEDLLTLEAALARLEVVDPRAAEVVVLRFYSGMSSAEVAEHLGLSVRTVEGDWTHARAWLKREVSGTHPSLEE